MEISKVVIQTLHSIQDDKSIRHELAAPAGLRMISHSQIKKLTAHSHGPFNYICIAISSRDNSAPLDYIMVGLEPFLQRLLGCIASNTADAPDIQPTDSLRDTLDKINELLEAGSKPMLSSGLGM